MSQLVSHEEAVHIHPIEPEHARGDMPVAAMVLATPIFFSVFGRVYLLKRSMLGWLSRSISMSTSARTSMISFEPKLQSTHHAAHARYSQHENNNRVAAKKTRR